MKNIKIKLDLKKIINKGTGIFKNKLLQIFENGGRQDENKTNGRNCWNGKQEKIYDEIDKELQSNGTVFAELIQRKKQKL